MKVKKRNGCLEDVSFDKVINRIQNHSKDLKNLNATSIAQYVCARIYDGVNTSELDELTSQICSSKITEHPEYGILSSRIIISNHHKNTSPSFSEVINILYNNETKLVSDELYNIVLDNKEKLNSIIDYERDYKIDYFGFKTLERSYLLKIKNKIIERPQHMFMRVSLGIHGNDIKEAIETYDMMSNKLFIHATPTLFNSGTPRPQMASCFLQGMEDDSIEGIFNTLKNSAHISKYSGGVGLHIHNIRCNGSYIKGTNGTSNGIIPMLSVFNKTAMYVDQCFRGDTHVYTINGIKKIEKIKDTDYVLTSDGSFKKVLKKISNKVSKQTYRVRTNNSIDTVYVTCDHKILVLQNMPSLPINELSNYLKENLKPKPKYVEIEKISTFDYVGYPIPQFNEEIDEDEDYCYYTGIIIGNGYIQDNNQIVSFYKEKGTEMKNFLLQYLKNNKIVYNYSYEKNKNIIKWEINDENKPIKNYLNLSNECTKYVLKGILKSSGCQINDNYNCMFYNVDENRKYICYIVKYLFLKLGILTDGFYKSEHKYNILCIPYCKKLFEIFNYNKEISDEKLTYFEHNNILWTSIKSIDKMNNFDGYVYDLNVENNHNYLTEMGIVHNSGKRNGNFAIYLEPTHPDIQNFIDLRKNHGNEAERCRELFTAIWIPDLFMEKVKNDEEWCLFCPSKCPDLSDVYGENYKILYEKYEKENKFEKKIKAQELWISICSAQKETGTPYLCFKDACNLKSNQQNIGTIKSSNLCSEIIEYSDKNETAVCNLASIALPSYIINNKFDYNKLHYTAKVLTKNLNKVIDKSFYPIQQTKLSNIKHRPIGIGVQGLADVFAILKIPFDSNEAKIINKQIFETIYHGALEMSMELAITYGPYETYKNSPIFNGKLQFDLWNVKINNDLWNWDKLRNDIAKNGIRNSLLIALMPTASTSQILGFNECFEPFTSNIYNRRTLAGEFFIINKYLINELINLNIWNSNIKNKIIENKGSIQNIDEIPIELKNIFKTAFEIHPKTIIELSADRGPFICQSQSMNIFIDDTDINKISNMHFYSWKKGLKTGIYYLRTRPSARVQSFTQEAKSFKQQNEKPDEEHECLNCSA
jgi:ribonucleoside-diphosphate reductase alpha subunit